MLVDRRVARGLVRKAPEVAGRLQAGEAYKKVCIARKLDVEEKAGYFMASEPTLGRVVSALARLSHQLSTPCYA